MNGLTLGPVTGTWRKFVLYACPCGVTHRVNVVFSVDADNDPTLVQNFLNQPEKFNRVNCSQAGDIEVPWILHSPSRKKLLLVLPEWSRVRVAEERKALLDEITANWKGDVPEYAFSFDVGFGAQSVTAWLSGLTTLVQSKPKPRALVQDTHVGPRPEFNDRMETESNSSQFDDALTLQDFESVSMEDTPAVVVNQSSDDKEPRSEPIFSAEEPEVSGTIGTGLGVHGPSRPDPKRLPTQTLLSSMNNVRERLDAAIELCERGEVRHVERIFDLVWAMTRGEAGRVLAKTGGLGPAAIPHLMKGLTHGKAYLRQGSALALAQVGGSHELAAICDLLFTEPTEIWREVARALGQAGEAAIAPLCARLRLAKDAQLERGAWAFAHIARVARPAVETLGKSKDKFLSGVARHGLELADLASREHSGLLSTKREYTVNRAFSKQFFDAMSTPDMTAAIESAAVLDDDDMIEVSEHLPN